MKFEKQKNKFGFYQVKPMPTQEELNEYYSKDYFQKCTSKTYSAEYSKDEKEYFRNISLIAERVWQKFSHKNKGSIIDVGCGEGYFIDYFAKKGWRIEACDFSSHGMKKHNPQILKHFVQGDIYDVLDNIIKNKKKYDFVNLKNVLEHVLDPLDLLEKLKKIMHSKSLLRIQVPNDFSSFQEFLVKKKLTEETWFSPPDHLSYFNFDSIKKLLNKKGFSVVTTLTDFPIEVFLFNKHSNYFLDNEKGKQAHLARTEISNFLLKQGGVDKYINYLSSSADLGFGRSIMIFVRLKAKEGD